MGIRTSYFWEDAQQASERLTNTYILHGDNPFLVRVVEPQDEVPRLHGRIYPSGRDVHYEADDPAFHMFRKLPPVGWVNAERHQEGLFLSRRPIRSRIHGLNESNVQVGYVGTDGCIRFGDYTFDSVARDRAYAQCCEGDYPSLDEVLSCIRNNTTIAISNKYAVRRDNEGIRWLHRLFDKVGLFSGNASLLLANSCAYLREELMEDPVITVNNIQEF